MLPSVISPIPPRVFSVVAVSLDRKSTRLNSSHLAISYAVFCLNKMTRAPEGVCGSEDVTITCADDDDRVAVAHADTSGQALVTIAFCEHGYLWCIVFFRLDGHPSCLPSSPPPPAAG